MQWLQLLLLLIAAVIVEVAFCCYLLHFCFFLMLASLLRVCAISAVACVPPLHLPLPLLASCCR
jgi:hypothetical protein